ncbi:hypothetical protein IQ254_28535 [Nodosilinea sp. LEGE 07088]|uniref:hypothetical protein n=1 Tax=Nodosilinea sp. LEGE 07088 TaxID=2777968 RepID=UPI001882EA09|nr:hypothetical protein [Nodosilinea sp. LEGE 07088]MBE9141101.1 hypothetical protein [Nodosilinea sp. LEGE 07088]
MLNAMGGVIVGGYLWGQLAMMPVLSAPPTETLLLTQSQPMLGQDTIPYPPVMRHGASPEGRYHLTLTLVEGADPPHTVASLFETLGDRCQQVWSRPLPHSYGPRLGLVNDSGTVVLLDEWINVASTRAVVVLGRDGDAIAEHSFDDIVAVTGETRAEVVEQAKQGFWLGGSPEMQNDGSYLAIPTAGGELTLNLATGAMGF